MKKGTILIIILGILFLLLIVIGVVAYNKIYVPGNFVMRLENTAIEGTNVVYIYENGKVIFNNAGINTIKTSMSEEDVQELLEQLPEYEIPTRLYVVTKEDGTEVSVINQFKDNIAAKLGIDDIFTEGVE